jgi:hypothetical protein
VIYKVSFKIKILCVVSTARPKGTARGILAATPRALTR